MVMASDHVSTEQASCFFCMMKEPDASIRRFTLKQYLKHVPFLDDEELILVVSGLWNAAMTRPDDEELPSLGVFECMASLIEKSIRDRKWLLANQNIYVPYYAAHIIGSYTLNKEDLAVRAVGSGVVPQLMDLLRGKMSWVEKRVAVRALGHLASYEKTFPAVVDYEDEVVGLAVQLASSCLEEVYDTFVGVKDGRKRSRYQSGLLTRGVGGVEMENRKAEEWASQMQCWSIHLLNCFAIKERSLGLICKEGFLEDLSEMWGGLVNRTSSGGVGLLRILCYSKVGRQIISKSTTVVGNLCKLSRSSDDWQYMAIDCLLLLLKDFDTRYNTMETACPHLADLVELRSLGSRTNVGKAITRAILYDYNIIKHQEPKIKNVDLQRSVDEIWDLKIDRRKRDQVMSIEDLERKRATAKQIKRQANEKYLMGEIEEALLKYSEALEICPLRDRNERVVLHSNRAECGLLMRDLDAAISDTTRALSLSSPPNCHADSLWTRSKAYDMKGMAKESLMDCLLFVNIVCKKKSEVSGVGVKIPYYAVRMISKQMGSTWLFRGARVKAKESRRNAEMMRNNVISGLPTILEEPLAGKYGSGRKNMERAKTRNKTM